MADSGSKPGRHDRPQKKNKKMETMFAVQEPVSFIVSLLSSVLVLTFSLNDSNPYYKVTDHLARPAFQEVRCIMFS